MVVAVIVTGTVVAYQFLYEVLYFIPINLIIAICVKLLEQSHENMVVVTRRPAHGGERVFDKLLDFLVVKRAVLVLVVDAPHVSYHSLNGSFLAHARYLQHQVLLFVSHLPQHLLFLLLFPKFFYLFLLVVILLPLEPLFQIESGLTPGAGLARLLRLVNR